MEMQCVYCEVRIIFIKNNFNYLSFNFEDRPISPSTHNNAPNTTACSSGTDNQTAGVYAIDAGQYPGRRRAAEPFFRHSWSLIQSPSVPHFINPDGSLPRQQQSATCHILTHTIQIEGYRRIYLIFFRFK
jgi:hypothetical protein